MSIGTMREENGLVKKCDNCMVVKKSGSAGDEIKRHNHPGNDIFFIVLKGEVEVTLEDDSGATEKHPLVPGRVLHFDGKNHISANMIKDSDVCICIVANNG